MLTALCASAGLGIGDDLSNFDVGEDNWGWRLSTPSKPKRNNTPEKHRSSDNTETNQDAHDRDLSPPDNFTGDSLAARSLRWIRRTRGEATEGGGRVAGAPLGLRSTFTQSSPSLSMERGYFAATNGRGVEGDYTLPATVLEDLADKLEPRAHRFRFLRNGGRRAQGGVGGNLAPAAGAVLSLDLSTGKTLQRALRSQGRRARVSPRERRSSERNDGGGAKAEEARWEAMRALPPGGGIGGFGARAVRPTRNWSIDEEEWDEYRVALLGRLRCLARGVTALRLYRGPGLLASASSSPPATIQLQTFPALQELWLEEIPSGYVEGLFTLRLRLKSLSFGSALLENLAALLAPHAAPDDGWGVVAAAASLPSATQLTTARIPAFLMSAPSDRRSFDAVVSSRASTRDGGRDGETVRGVVDGTVKSGIGGTVSDAELLVSDRREPVFSRQGMARKRERQDVGDGGDRYLWRATASMEACSDGEDLAGLKLRLGTGTPALRWALLEVLSVRCCGLRELDPSLRLLPRVRRLSLAYNCIPSIEYFQDCAALEELDLSFNRIRSVENAHRVLGNLRSLNLQGNRLTRTLGLERVFSLEELDLSRNGIRGLEEVSRLSTLPFLHRVAFAGNPLEAEERKQYRVTVLSLLYQGKAGELERALALSIAQNGFILSTGVVGDGEGRAPRADSLGGAGTVVLDGKLSSRKELSELVRLRFADAVMAPPSKHLKHPRAPEREGRGLQQQQQQQQQQSGGQRHGIPARAPPSLSRRQSRSSLSRKNEDDYINANDVIEDDGRGGAAGLSRRDLVQQSRARQEGSPDAVATVTVGRRRLRGRSRRRGTRAAAIDGPQSEAGREEGAETGGGGDMPRNHISFCTVPLPLEDDDGGEGAVESRTIGGRHDVERGERRARDSCKPRSPEVVPEAAEHPGAGFGEATGEIRQARARPSRLSNDVTEESQSPDPANGPEARSPEKYLERRRRSIDRGQGQGIHFRAPREPSVSPLVIENADSDSGDDAPLDRRYRRPASLEIHRPRGDSDKGRKRVVAVAAGSIVEDARDYPISRNETGDPPAVGGISVDPPAAGVAERRSAPRVIVDDQNTAVGARSRSLAEATEKDSTPAIEERWRPACRERRSFDDDWSAAAAVKAPTSPAPFLKGKEQVACADALAVRLRAVAVSGREAGVAEADVGVPSPLVSLPVSLPASEQVNSSPDDSALALARCSTVPCSEQIETSCSGRGEGDTGNTKAFSEGVVGPRDEEMEAVEGPFQGSTVSARLEDMIDGTGAEVYDTEEVFAGDVDGAGGGGDGYRGDAAYASLLIAEHLELYLRQQVFGGGPAPYVSYSDARLRSPAMHAHQERSKTLLDDKVVAVFRETVLPCLPEGFPFLSRAGSERVAAGDAELDLAWERRSAEDLIAAGVARVVRLRGLSGEARGVTMAPRPRVLLVLPLGCLEKTTIGFRLQKLELHLNASCVGNHRGESSTGRRVTSQGPMAAAARAATSGGASFWGGVSSSPQALSIASIARGGSLRDDGEPEERVSIVLLTRDRSRTVNLVQSLETLATKARRLLGLPPTVVNNRDEDTLEAIAKALPCSLLNITRTPRPHPAISPPASPLGPAKTAGLFAMLGVAGGGGNNDAKLITETSSAVDDASASVATTAAEAHGVGDGEGGSAGGGDRAHGGSEVEPASRSGPGSGSSLETAPSSLRSVAQEIPTSSRRPPSSETEDIPPLPPPTAAAVALRSPFGGGTDGVPASFEGGVGVGRECGDGYAVVVFQLLMQRWELRPWVVAPRTLVASKEQLALMDEDHSRIQALLLSPPPQTPHPQQPPLLPPPSPATSTRPSPSPSPSASRASSSPATRSRSLSTAGFSFSAGRRSTTPTAAGAAAAGAAAAALDFSLAARRSSFIGDGILPESSPVAAAAISGDPSIPWDYRRAGGLRAVRDRLPETEMEMLCLEAADLADVVGVHQEESAPEQVMIELRGERTFDPRRQWRLQCRTRGSAEMIASTVLRLSRERAKQRRQTQRQLPWWKR